MFEDLPECRQAARMFDFGAWNGKLYIILLKLNLILNIFSNTLVVYGLLRTDQLRRLSNRLFFALSLNGLVAGTLAMTSLCASIFVQTEDGCQFWSRLNGDVVTWHTHGEDFGTTMLAMDRLIHIRSSWKSYILFSKRKTLIIFLTISYIPGLMLVFVSRHFLWADLCDVVKHNCSIEPDCICHYKPPINHIHSSRRKFHTGTIQKH